MIIVSDVSNHLQALAILYLECDGYDVREVKDAGELFELIEDHRQEVKLVLVELDPAGKDILRMVKERYAIPTVIFARHGVPWGDEGVDQLMKIGAYSVLDEGSVHQLPQIAESLKISRVI